MKKLLFPLAAVSLLGGCELFYDLQGNPDNTMSGRTYAEISQQPSRIRVPLQTSWSDDCAKHYSITAREKSNCLKKVEANKKVDITPGQITVDPGNTSRETFDDIGKGGAYDSNTSSKLDF